MKKAICSLLVCIIIFCSMPFRATATEIDSTDRQELITMACQVFPEYSSTIRGENIAPRQLHQSADLSEVVFHETRKYSDDCDITYTEFSDGSALIASNNVVSTITTTDSVTNSTLNVTYTSNLKLTYSYSDEVFLAEGVKYTVDWQAYDKILTSGNLSKSTTDRAETIYNGKKWTEDSQGPAYIKYWVSFTSSVHTTPVDITYIFYVGNNLRCTNYDSTSCF